MDIKTQGEQVKITEQASLCLLYTVMQVQPTNAQAGEAIAFNIPAQSLSSALLQFSTDSGIRIFFKAELTRARKSKSLTGLYTPQQALDKLLANTGIQYHYTATHSVTLSQQPNSQSVPLLDLDPPVVVYAQLKDKYRPINQMDSLQGKQPWNGYQMLSASTATRVDTPIMELSQSIQVIPRALMDDQQAVTVSESLRNVSGVVPRTSGITPNFEPTLIRGFSTMQMIDGFYQNLNTGDPESLVNIQQIEVIKGANATFYSGGGGSPTGGIVNLISKLPEKDAFYELGIKAGNYNFVQPYVDINQPLSEQFLFRFTGEYTHSKSHIDVLKTEYYNLNPSITWTNNDSSSLSIQAKYSKWSRQDYQGLPATGTVAGDFTLNPTLFIGPADIGDSASEFASAWATFEHQFNDTWAITAKARYAYSEHDTITQGIVGEGFDFGADKPLSTDDLAALGQPYQPHTWGLLNDELYQQSNEMTFQLYSTAQFDYKFSHNALVLGADYSRHNEVGFIEFDPLPIGLVDLTKPSFLPYNYPGDRQNNQYTNNTTYGAYTQLQSSFYDRLHLLAGLRVGHISSDFKNTTPGSGFSSNANSTRVLPNVGAVLDLSDEFALFVNYSEGMRAQSGVNFVATPKPELSDQLEFGLKFDIAEQLTGQLALYRINKKNIAVTDFTDPLQRASTKGRQRSQGVESNLSWQPNAGLKMLATYAYTDARFADDLIVMQGNYIPGVPEHAGRLWINYAFQNTLLQGLSIGAGVYAQSSVYLENKNQFKSDAFYTVDTSIAYTRERYKIGLAIKNLSNVNYFQRLDYFGTRVMPAQGTEVFLTGTMTF